MAWTRDKREHARRLSICETCPHAVLTVAGACDTCRRPRIVRRARTDDDLACQHKDCAGTVRGKEIPRCGACGCPLASRVYSTCPEGKW